MRITELIQILIYQLYHVSCRFVNLCNTWWKSSFFFTKWGQFVLDFHYSYNLIMWYYILLSYLFPLSQRIMHHLYRIICLEKNFNLAPGSFQCSASRTHQASTVSFSKEKMALDWFGLLVCCLISVADSACRQLCIISNPMSNLPQITSPLKIVEVTSKAPIVHSLS